MAFDSIGANAYNYGPCCFKICFCVAKLARLFRSPRRIVFRIKPEYDFLPAKILQSNLLTIGILEGKTRGFTT